MAVSIIIHYEQGSTMLESVENKNITMPVFSFILFQSYEYLHPGKLEPASNRIQRLSLLFTSDIRVLRA